MTATLRAREPPNAGADSIVSAVTFSVHEGVSTSTRARPRAWFAAVVARQHVRARAHDRLRAPRAAPRRGASLRQKVRCDRAIDGPIRFSDASAFYVPEATRDASTSARSAHDVNAPAESRDAHARATRVSVAARTPPLSRSAPAARRASGQSPVGAAPRGRGVRWPQSCLFALGRRIFSFGFFMALVSTQTDRDRGLF